MAAFDTHKAVKALCSAGFDDAQAEAVVDQISGAIHENVATKTDIDKLATKDELRQEVTTLATRDELRQAVAKLATRDELRQAVAKLATKDELRQEVEKLELRLAAELEKQSSKYLRSMVVVVAGIVGLSKALELLWA